MTKLHVKRIEFYITNVCNFNCDGCNRFNNINFSGSQRWADYKDAYARWAEILDFDEFTILGGEPMTCPDYLDWLGGVRDLWPNATGTLLTNGYYLNEHDRQLYDLLKNSQGRIIVDIGLHNSHRAQPMLEKMKKWLVGDIEIKRGSENLRAIPGFDGNWKRSYDKIRDYAWPDCDTVDQWPQLPQSIRDECETIHKFSPDILAEARLGWSLRDSNGVTVKINYENYFSQNNLIVVNNGESIRLHDSDPLVAHNTCSMAINKCYHFIRGKLYKCGPVGLFPELESKFNIDLSEQDRSLIHSYQPGTFENI